MTNKLRELFETHGLMSVRKQRSFANFLGQHAFEYDKAQGTLSLPAQGQTSTEPRVYKVQVLGSEDSKTWLWAWANAQSEFPEGQLQAAQRLKILGEEHGIEEFTAPRLPLDRVSGHLLASVALGILDMPAYYRGAVGQTSLVCLLEGVPPLSPIGGAELVATLGDAISNFEFRNHRKSVEAFLGQLGLAASWEANAFNVTTEDGVLVIGQFDDKNRLAKLSTRLPAQTSG